MKTARMAMTIGAFLAVFSILVMLPYTASGAFGPYARVNTQTGASAPAPENKLSPGDEIAMRILDMAKISWGSVAGARVWMRSIDYAAGTPAAISARAPGTHLTDIQIQLSGRPNGFDNRIAGKLLYKITYRDTALGKQFATWANVDIEVTLPVVVSLKRISPRQVMTAENLAVETRDVTTLAGGYIPGTELDKILTGGFMASVTVGERAHLMPVALAKAPDVRMGEAVTLVLKSGLVTIRTKASLLEAGVVGRQVRVRTANPKMTKTMTGVLTGRDTVEVTL